MKRAVWITAVLGFTLMSGSWAMALDAPGSLECAVVGNHVQFAWNPVAGADRYSIDVEVPIFLDGEDAPYRIVELSFGGGDRKGAEAAGNRKLSVHLSEFVYDVNGVDDDGWLDLLSGKATAKVTALKTGKGRGKQNHPFSQACSFELP